MSTIIAESDNPPPIEEADEKKDKSNGEAEEKKADRPPRKDRRFNVPERWEEYSPVGKVIPDAHIVCFKTPLKSGFYKAEDERRFEVSHLLAEIEKNGGQLGLVVDLTFTHRYYDKVDFTDAGIEYRKIMVPGRNNEELANNGALFIECLREFFDKPENKGKWVGVHCTHGLNRTGYLVCRYLHEALGWPMDEAIRKFEEARGHKIDREEYVDMLKNFRL